MFKKKFSCFEIKKLNDLWCSYIKKFSLNLFRNEAFFDIELTDRYKDSGQSYKRYYKLDLHEIIDFHFFDHVQTSFEEKVLEITEIHFSKKNDNYFFEIIIWDEDKMLEIECKKYSLEMYKEVEVEAE